MENFLVLTFLFAFGAIGGWVLELLFRRVVHKKWVNPGFLHGPYLPIYGFGVVALYAIAEIPLPIDAVWLKLVVQTLIVCVGMTALEFVSGIVFIKRMGIKLWDYSDRKGNVGGIICPLFSLIWTVIGGVYVIFLHGNIVKMVSWFTGNLWYSFFVGLFFGLLLSDLVYTLNVVEKLRGIAKEQKLVVRYEELKLKIKTYFEAKKLKYNFLLPFRAPHDTLKRLLNKSTEAEASVGEEEKRKSEKGTPEKTEKENERE